MSLPAPVPAVSVALYVAGTFLLVRRARQPAKGLYAFPGGRIEAGETPIEAAIREMREETGLIVDEVDFFLEMRLPGGSSGYRLSVFRAGAASGALQAGDDAAEAGWFSLAEMETLPVTETTLAIARRIAGAVKNGAEAQSCLRPNCR